MNVSGVLPLSILNVSLSLDGRSVLSNVTLDILPHERTIVLGPNGAGKTTLLRLCHGLIAPDSGEVCWRGPQAGMRSRRQAMVFQRPVMLRRTVRSNIAYGLKFTGLPRTQREERVSEVLEVTGLDKMASRPARSLSTGEQHRVAIARAWALGPEVLFLDEPTASLDPGATRAVERLVEFVSGAGTAVVITTQDLAQARRLADRIIFFHNGSAIEVTSAESFFLQPKSKEAQAFMAGELLWPGAVDLDRLRLCAG
tara:strand:+ start:481 stop:1245 length:765 start_codon:yes stop_codon:yes gene_type:complete